MILVTGGAGYVGSHAVRELRAAGIPCVVLDNLSRGHREMVADVDLIVGDIGDAALVGRTIRDYGVTAVMHFAAYAYVGESVAEPLTYYGNNVAATVRLLGAMVEHDVKTFVFSSTCATYGVPETTPITETHPQRPINPYGATKLTVERILQDVDHAHGVRSVVFRYFNAAGADPSGAIGERHIPETHLIPLTLQAEFDYGTRTRDSGQKTHQLAVYQEIDWLAGNGVNFLLAQDWSDPDVEVQDDHAWRLTAGLQLTPFPGVAVDFRTRVLVPAEEQRGTDFLVQLRLYN